MNPKQQARRTIDAMLTAAGWAVQDYKAFDMRDHLVECIADLKLSLDAGYSSSLMQMATSSGNVFNAIFRTLMPAVNDGANSGA